MHRSDRSYIITGGLGGFGMALADYLAQNGARHLVITSKRGVHNGGQQAALTELYHQGINVCAGLRVLLACLCLCDVRLEGTLRELSQMLAQCTADLGLMVDKLAE